MITYRQWLDEQADFTNDREEALEVYLQNEHKTLEHEFNEEKIEQFENVYQGQWDTFKAFCEERFPETTSIPDHLAGYIDYGAVARDWQHEYWYTDGHVFSNW